MIASYQINKKYPSRERVQLKELKYTYIKNELVTTNESAITYKLRKNKNNKIPGIMTKMRPIPVGDKIPMLFNLP